MLTGKEAVCFILAIFPYFLQSLKKQLGKQNLNLNNLYSESFLKVWGKWQVIWEGREVFP